MLFLFVVFSQTYCKSLCCYMTQLIAAQPPSNPRPSPLPPSHTHFQIRRGRHSRAFKKLSRAKYRAAAVAVGVAAGAAAALSRNGGSSSQRWRSLRPQRVCCAANQDGAKLGFQFSDASAALCDPSADCTDIRTFSPAYCQHSVLQLPHDAELTPAASPHGG